MVKLVDKTDKTINVGEIEEESFNNIEESFNNIKVDDGLKSVNDKMWTWTNVGIKEEVYNKIFK